MSKQNRIISEIKTILNSLPQLNIVGEYPTDIDNIGNNTNVVLIKGGDESYISSPGKRYEVTFDVKLYIYIQGTTELVSTLSSLSEIVMNKMVSDQSINGEVCTFQIRNINKGEFNDTNVDYSNAGVYPETIIITQDYQAIYYIQT